MNRIALISGSHRPAGASSRIADLLGRLAAEHLEGSETETISLDGIPLWDEGLWAQREAAPHWDEWRRVAARLREADAFIIIAPEYGGMVPPRLSNFLLLCSSEEVGHKPALAVAVSSTRGGSYPIAQLRAHGSKNNRLCWLPDHLIIRDARSDAAPESLSGPGHVARYAEYCLRLLDAYASSLKEVRRSGIIDHRSFPYGM